MTIVQPGAFQKSRRRHGFVKPLGTGNTATTYPLILNGQLDAQNNAITVVLWLDATVGVTADGSNRVSRWADQSTLGNDAVQSVNGNKPLTGQGTIGGKNVLSFDGVDDCLDSVARADVATVLAVLQPGAVDLDLNNYVPVGDTTQSSTAHLILLNNSNAAPQWIAGPANNCPGSASLAQVVLGRLVIDGSLVSVMRQGAESVTGGPETGNPDAGVRVGGDADASGPGTPANPWLGTIGEIVVCSGALTTTQQDSLMAYAAAKWGV